MNTDEAENVLFAEADVLTDLARKRLRELHPQKDAEPPYWEDMSARWHFWKGIDEFCSANHHVKEGDIESMETCIADGWNHVLMASYVAYSEEPRSSCEHLPLKELDQSDLRYLRRLCAEPLGCPDCGVKFEIERDDHDRELYLINRDRGGIS